MPVGERARARNGDGVRGEGNAQVGLVSPRGKITMVEGQLVVAAHDDGLAERAGVGSPNKGADWVGR